MCDKENCNCGSNPCCGDCEPWNCVEQAVNDVWATKETQIEGLVDRAETAAENSEASAKASADSAAEAKEFRDEAETAATTAVAAEGVVLGVANTLQDTADKLKQIADELNSAIAGISVVTWHYTAVSDNQTVIPVPVDKNQVDVQAIYIEGARQEPNRGFTYDALNKEITLAEGIPLGLEISIIIGTYSDNPNDFAGTLASNNGASLVGTSRGITVQQTINELDRSFQDGGVLRSPNDTLLDKSTNPYQEYVWTGASSTFPKVVPPGSTPLSTGGIADGAWVKVGDASLRSELSANDGFKFIGTVPSMAALKTQEASFDGQLIQLRSWNAGLNLGGGIFQWDAASTKPDDSGCVVQVTGVSTGRWIRQGVTDKTPEMFGAIGNGSAPGDNAAIQRMFDSANNSATLAENFFGTFKLRRKYLITQKISCGRPIKVDAYGAEFVVNSAIPCVEFSMHNGLWEGGFFNYMGVANEDINENAVAMSLAPESNPIQVMNSSIRGIRVWGAHTGIKFTNDNTAIWMLDLANHELGVRAGSSSMKAHGILLNSTNGAGGNTTVNIRKVAVHGKGDIGGAGLKGYVIKGVNDITFDDYSYDGYEFAPGVPRNVGEGDIMDIECFRCTIDGLHLEQIVNDVGPFSKQPINIATNSCYINGFENLLCSSEKGGGWISLTGNGVAVIGAIHLLPAPGKTAGKILDISLWNSDHDADAVINCIGNVRPIDIIGGNTRHKVNFSCAPSVYNINADVQVKSAGNILDLGFDRQAAIVTVVGERVGSSDMSFFAVLHCLRNNVGGWTFNMAPPTKSPNFNAAVINFGFTGNNLAFLIEGDTNTYRIQSRIETDRAALTAYF